MTQLTERQYAIIEEAADWSVRLDGETMSKAEQRALADWLLISSEHVQEFLYAAATLQALGDIKEPERVPIDLLLADKAPDVLPLFYKNTDDFIVSTLEKHTNSTSLTHWNALSRIAAAVAFVLISATAFLGLQTPFSEREDNVLTYNTTTGEQRSISLSDGSVVHLNTRSKVRVDYRRDERAIELLEGEALFKVAHDPNRPFRVYAGTAIAEAIGTTFNVYRKLDQTNVAVVNGKVSVTANDKTPDTQSKPYNPAIVENSLQPVIAVTKPILLTSGQETTVNLQGAILPARAKPTKFITSWRDRRLVFENQDLATIAKEFNRYNRIKIIIDDSALSSVEFDGVFDADDPEAFIRFLKLTGQIEVHRILDNEIRLRHSLKKPAVDSSI